MAVAQDRTALLVGMTTSGGQPLPSVEKDLATVAAALTNRGYRVTARQNLGRKDFETVLTGFAAETVTNGMAVVYFAGLAEQKPVATPPGGADNNLRLADGSVAVAAVLKNLRDRGGAGAHVIVLDTGHEDPAAKPGQSAGLVEFRDADLADDTLIIAAPSPEGGGPSSLAAAFAKAVAAENDTLGQLVDAVGEHVTQISKGKQKPVIAGVTPRLRRLPLVTGEEFIQSLEPPVGTRAGQQWANGLGMAFCWCPPGSFTMGLPETDTSPEAADARPVQVTISKGFWIGKYEVTELQANGRHGPKGRNLPCVTNSCEKFLGAVNQSERKAGRLPDTWRYRLPTEAQWEYAARAGRNGQFSFGDDASDLHRYANFADETLLKEDPARFFYASSRLNDGAGAGPTAVGSYLPNDWGLHDIHGNVAEWCRDTFSRRLLPPLGGGSDPLQKGDKEDLTSALRGGSWCSLAEYCRCGFRNARRRDSQLPRMSYTGLRLVLEMVEGSK
jgi:formylglycine-generating enzyme required for sulfatase activity